jgi:hypothetical protein
MGYNCHVTAKEALRELVDDMSEAEARDAFDVLARMFQAPRERPPLSVDEMRAMEQAIRRLDAGEGIPHSEVKRRFNL